MAIQRLKPQPREALAPRASKIFVIATEGRHTERQYVEILRSHRAFDGKKIHVEVLPTLDGSSAPEYVLERLDAMAKKYEFDHLRDELWMVIDFDRWGDAKLADVNRLCNQKGFRHAVSRPCFELWLLLHHEEAQLQFGRCAEVEDRIRELVGEYNKSNLKLEHYPMASIDSAITRAKMLDTKPDDAWPNTQGTRVYRLVESLKSA